MPGILEQIENPSQLKAMTFAELKQLAGEIREKIICTVGTNGGHLGSNLGVVEITITLLRAFNTPPDKIIWDVGHQCYPHKLLTGRYKQFHTLRQYQGISGFPKRNESPFDVLDTGHASTSIAAALGMAKARDLNNEDFHVIAVIGDGAMTGGLALEGLNQAGYLNTDLIILLNDNRMSISLSVGALSNYTHRISKTEVYQQLKKDINELVKNADRLELKKLASNIKKHAKAVGTPGLLFEKLGLNYLGPVDGHNLQALNETFEKAKSLKGPRLIHAITEKGKGYHFAEQNQPKYHGVSPFNTKNGENLSKSDIADYTSVFADTLVKLAATNKKIVAITAAMPDGTGLTKFQKLYPERFFDVGIAEQFAVTFAAGMALNGLKPVVAIYSSFLQRAYDQVIHDVCLQNLPIVFALDRAGIVGEDGPTHHGVFDLSYLRAIPNIVIMAPKDENELQDMIKTAIEYDNGPIAIRYPRGQAVGVDLNETPGSIPIGEYEILRHGDRAVVLAVGAMVVPALQATENLAKKGIDLAVVNARFVKPLDSQLLDELSEKHDTIITIEENTLNGGFGSAIHEYFAKQNCHCKIRSIGLPDKFIEHGSLQIIRENTGLTSPQIERQLEAILSVS